MPNKLLVFLLFIGVFIPSVGSQANWYLGSVGQTYNNYVPSFGGHIAGYNLNSMPGGGGWGGFPAGYHGLPAGYGSCSGVGIQAFPPSGSCSVSPQACTSCGMAMPAFPVNNSCNLSPQAWTSGFGGYYSRFIP